MEVSFKNGWVESLGNPVYSIDGTYFLVISSNFVSDKGDARRMIAVPTGWTESEILPITSNKYHVTEILGWNERDHHM